MAKEEIKKEIPADFWNHNINKITGFSRPVIKWRQPDIPTFSVNIGNVNGFNSKHN